MAQRPLEIEAALSALEILSSEISEDKLLLLKKTLPALAIKMAQAGEDVNTSMLIDHVQQGEEHLTTLKEQYSQKPQFEKLTYEGVLETLKKKNTQDTDLKNEDLNDLVKNRKSDDILSFYKAGNVDEALCSSALKGDLEAVRLLLEMGADIHFKADFAIRAAAQYGYFSTVKFLIDKGADIHAHSDHALRFSSQYCHVDVVKLLIKSGADIHRDYDFALRIAVHSGHFELADFLIQNGADVNAHRGKPLERAVQNGHLNLVQLLLDNGADAQADNNNVLFLASKYGHLEILKLLMNSGADINANNDRSLSAAVLNGHFEVADFLIQNGASVQVDHNNNLFVASENGHADIVRLLIYNGANIHANNGDVLLNAVRNGHFDVVEILLDWGADFYCTQPRHLLYAMDGEHMDVLDLLLKKGWDRQELVGEKERDYKRYLHWCKIHKDEAIALSLFQENPYHFKRDTFEAVRDIMIVERYENKIADQYAYHASALFMSEHRVLQYLQKWGEDGKQPLHDIIQNIKIPRDGNPDLKSWGDAVLKHGPKMAKLVKFSDRLMQPMKDGSGGWSYTKTKQEIAKHAFKRGQENPELAAFCLEYAWEEDDFEDALKQIKKFEKKYSPSDNIGRAANDNIKGGAIPDITINGEAFGKGGYTFKKLPDGDVRGLLLGEFTNCCQHLAGEGEDCAKHGFLSEYGGFYVVQDDKTEAIIAQSWAWRGKKGELVFDSLESLKGHFDKEKWTSLCDAFSKQVAKTLKDTGIKVFHIGGGGATPDLAYSKSNLAKPLDYKGYRDSKDVQYIVAEF